MNRIDRENQKKIMVQILEYFDNICRENNIDYSLIGGSLIGAIRHKGIIPWDDDIDVILTYDNYKKVIEILKKNNDKKYKILDSETCSDYFLPFPKLIDTSTYVEEPLFLHQIKEYGIFIDIFCYFNIPNDSKLQYQTIRKIKFLNGLLARKRFKLKEVGIKKYFMNLFRNIFTTIIGRKKLINKLNNLYEKCSNENSEYVVSNWPIYPMDNEIQRSKNIMEYIDTSFENINVKIFKNYDAILKTTFGDYMKLPPKEKRVSHGLIAYWRDDCCEEKK